MSGWVMMVLWVLSVVVGLPAAGLWVALKAKGMLVGLGLWWVFTVFGWVEGWSGPLGLPWIVAWLVGAVLGVWWAVMWVTLTRRAWSRAVEVFSERKSNL
jgi:hypothetical protein